MPDQKDTVRQTVYGYIPNSDREAADRRQILDYLERYPVLKQVLTFALNTVIVIIIVAIILRLSRKLFQKFRTGKRLKNFLLI